MPESKLQMNGRRAGYSVGTVCASCGLCFARGTHRYAIAEYLPAGWAFIGATFLVCASCGTAHAIEHAAKPEASDRLRARRGPFTRPLSPKARRTFREVLNAWKGLKFPSAIQQQPQRPNYSINLIPPPRWKRDIKTVGDALLNLSVHIVAYTLTFLCLPVIIFEVLQDELWDRSHPPEDWQKRNPLLVTSPEMYEKRVQQLLTLHRHYEALWPVVIEELPVPPTDNEAVAVATLDPYASLLCAHCGTQGSLMTSLPASAYPEVTRLAYPHCPSCKRTEVLCDDDIADLDSSLYLMGDVLYDKPLWQHEWIQQFSSFQPPRSETGIFRLHNYELKPFQVTSLPADATQIWVPPGHTYEVHIKAYEDESSKHDTRLAHWYMYEVVGVFENGRVIYKRE